MIESGVINNIWSKYKIKPAEVAKAIIEHEIILFVELSWRWPGCPWHGKCNGNIFTPFCLFWNSSCSFHLGVAC